MLVPWCLSKTHPDGFHYVTRLQCLYILQLFSGVHYLLIPCYYVSSSPQWLISTATGSIVQGYQKSVVNRGNVRLGRPDKIKNSTALVAAATYTMGLTRVVMTSCHLSTGLFMTRYVKSQGGVERLESFAKDGGFQRGNVPWIVRQT